MLAYLFFAAFLSTFLYVRIILSDRNWREWFLISSIIMGAIIALLTESLSVLHALNRISLAVVWGLYLFGMMLVILPRINIINNSYRQKYHLPQEYNGIRSIQERFSNWIQNPENIVLLIVALFVILLLLIARIAPPNTNDSLYYHMSRVVNWAQNGTLDHYVTPINRQLWMPPWTEYAILNLFLLSRSDSLSNLVQWFAMLGSLIGVSVIARMLGSSRGGQIFAVIFCLTIRMGILQSTSTQTDYATAFWTVCLAYLTILVHQKGLFQSNGSTVFQKWFLPLLLSLTVGLGILTKGTFTPFALPFLVWLLLSIFKHHHWISAFKLSLLGLGVVLLMNIGVWWRNYQTFQAPLGLKTGLHTNELFTPGVLFSNLIRNSTLHLGTPYGIVNGPLREAIEWVHNILGLDVDDPRTTLETYRIKRSLHEDYAGNPLHFLFIPFSLVLLSKSIRRTFYQPFRLEDSKLQSDKTHLKNPPNTSLEGTQLSTNSYFLAVLLGFVFFSLLFKWQPTGSRLQLPFFVLFSPIAGVVYDRIRIASGKYFLVGLFLITSFPSLFSNPSRPLIQYDSNPSILQSPRTELLFVNSPEFMPGYLSIIEAIRNTSCRNIGLEIDSHHPDYPFWALLSPTATETQMEYYTEAPELEKYRNVDFTPCAVICTICTDQEWDGLQLDSIHYGGYYLYLEAR